MLGILPGAALTACSGSSQAEGGTTDAPNKTDDPTPARRTAEPTPTLNARPRYITLAGEVEPRCKEAAVATVAAALTWSPPLSAADAASRIAGVGGNGNSIAKAFRPFLQGHSASTVRVIYPQYGGLSDNVHSASVMVVAEQTYSPHLRAPSCAENSSSTSA